MQLDVGIEPTFNIWTYEIHLYVDKQMDMQNAIKNSKSLYTSELGAF